jgi:hypothetical protein
VLEKLLPHALYSSAFKMIIQTFLSYAGGGIAQSLSVGIAMDYGLDGRGIGVRVPVEENFSPFHVVQTGSGAHPASYPMGTGGKAAGVKRT